ncbi:MAG: cytochrome C [Deltaproteobacteria bacterium]|nr:cytochrome C [Deltaproteobacteria bacterium]
MEKPDRKIGKPFLVFAGICLIALPLIVFAALSSEPEEIESAVVETQSQDFDQDGNAIFEDYDRITRDYLEGTSTERTLSEYYSRRQYLMSPPFIPHKLEDEKNEEMDCLTCHEKGGWTDELKRNTPRTPHPENIQCMQCHTKPKTEELFVTNIWTSVSPPRLGRSHLPGGPPPIPHDLQRRGACIACHVGPGTVTEIRVEHPSRGNCRQCHVTDSPIKPFQRESSPG